MLTFRRKSRHRSYPLALLCLQWPEGWQVISHSSVAP